MPVIIALLGIIATAAIWYWRMKAAGQAAQDLAGVAQDVMSAARRFGFRRRYNEHPVESLQDGDVAIAGAALAFLELSALPTAEQQDALLISLQRHLGYDRAGAEEAVILGRWLINESKGADPGLKRLTKRVWKLKGAEGFAPLMQVVKDIAAASRDGTLSPRQRDALDDMARQFRVS
ncbi:hypothetical protein [Paracoccus sp. IB05]|uniref:hypothetical protein n=1 Tax=Paracoccus sp. IB05 TaxID=2779367 RepID=UPI0018E855C2|nr:hypothetical protein [Paracoccus sp. IB05]MBJ2151924.1 hypothetical protein [Paracoccus sp. IB05]